MAASTTSGLASFPYLTIHKLNATKEEAVQLPGKRTKLAKKTQWVEQRIGQLQERIKQISRWTDPHAAQAVVFPLDSKRTKILQAYTAGIEKEQEAWKKTESEYDKEFNFLTGHFRESNQKKAGDKETATILLRIWNIQTVLSGFHENALAELELQKQLFIDEEKDFKAKDAEGEDEFVTSQIGKLELKIGSFDGTKEAARAKRITECYLGVLRSNLVQIQERVAAERAASVERASSVEQASSVVCTDPNSATKPHESNFAKGKISLPFLLAITPLKRKIIAKVFLLTLIHIIRSKRLASQ